MTRRNALKVIRENFSLPTVDYSEERGETYRVKWYNMQPWILTPATLTRIKVYMAKKHPNVDVKLVGAISGKGTQTKSLVMNFPKREYA